MLDKLAGIFSGTVKSKNCVFLISDKNYFFALCVLVRNLNKYCSDFDLVVLEDGSLTDNDKEIVLNLKHNTEFLTVTLDCFCKIYNIKSLSKVSEKFIKRYSHLEYLKIEIFYLLDRYNSVMLLDIDIIINQNIDELFSLSCDIAWKNSKKLMDKMKDILNTKISISEFETNFDNNTLAPSGGLIIVNKNFNYKDAYSYGQKILTKLVNIKGACIDEILISLIREKFNLDLRSLDKKIYNTSPFEVSYDTKIIHFIGELIKPWTNPIIQSHFRKWINDYIELTKKYNIESEKVVIFNDYGNDIVKNQFTQQAWFSIVSDNNFKYIPDDVKCRNNFNDDTLIFDYSPNLYYLLKYECGKEIFSAGLMIFGKNAVNSHNINEEIKNIIQNIPSLNIKKSKDNIYIYSKNYNKDDIFREFNFFYKNTSKLRNLL